MNWARRLLRFAVGEPAGANPDIQAELERFHARLLAQSLDLAQHAELAPDSSAQAELARLAAEEQALAARFRAAIGEPASAPATPPGSEPPAPDGLNHWARLVRDLERHRESRARLFEAAIRLAETEPSLARLLETLSREEEEHSLRLRNLVARADPQALD